VREKRHWENWDQGDVAERIDRFWGTDSGEWALRRQLADEVVKFVGGDFPVLEVGSGSGRMAQEFVQRGFTKDTYEGGDVSDMMLGMARLRLPEFTFRKLDIFALPDETFSSVVCIHVLQHLPEFETPLRELLRVAHRKLVVVTWFAEQTEINLSHWGGVSFYNNAYRESELVDFVRDNAGDQSVSVTTRTTRTHGKVHGSIEVVFTGV